MTLQRASTDSLRAAGPLPTQFISTGEGIGGRIKVRPEDFVVEELPRYEPCGEGEHLYLRVQKINVSHGEAVRALADFFRIPEYRIGCAGMKDKRAVTSQTFSIHTPREITDDAVIHPNMKLLWISRHTNKLRRGHLAGNRFAIRVREVDPAQAPVAARTLDELERVGVPNYFGPQRFGYRRNTHILGALVLKRDWSGLLDELLGTSGSTFPEYQREHRLLFDRGEYARAKEMWSRNDAAERAGLQGLARGHDLKRVCLGLGRRSLAFFVSAAQSAIFNALLDQRIESRLFACLLPGDLAWKHDSRSVFAVTEDDAKDPATIERLARLEVSPSGPLWGPGMIRPGGAVADWEYEALRRGGLDLDDLDRTVVRYDGSRRPMRIAVANQRVEGGVDEHGQYIGVAFDLPRGSYATVVLRELMRRDDLEGDRAAQENADRGRPTFSGGEKDRKKNG